MSSNKIATKPPEWKLVALLLDYLLTTLDSEFNLTSDVIVLLN